jgi:uncharacterized protein YdaU (DUF1376 family)
VNFYKRHLGDYAKDAGHLSMLEHGAYTLLLDRYYTTERPIASRDEAYRVCRARSRVEQAAVDAVLREFFTADGDAFVKGRCEEEIAKAAHQRTVNQELGKRGGRPKRTESTTEHITDSVPIHNPSQTPDSNTSVANATGGEPPSVEELTRQELWSAGKSLLLEQGMPKAQCGSFVGKLVSDYGEQAVIDAVRSAVSNRPADAVTYLKATCMRLKGDRKDPPTVEHNPRVDATQRLLAEQAAHARTPPPAALLAIVGKKTA